MEHTHTHSWALMVFSLLLTGLVWPMMAAEAKLAQLDSEADFFPPQLKAKVCNYSEIFNWTHNDTKQSIQSHV